MPASAEVADQTDWFDTPVAGLARVEAALRCQVCKDFFDTPMITSCAHTFCSLCIRRCLTNDGACPACRARDQEVRLRPNAAVQDLVEAFQAARSSVLQLGRDARMGEPNHDGRKRKREEVSPRRSTRSRPTPDELEDVADHDDGLAACPVCQKRMKEIDVFSHLDTHADPQPNSMRKMERLPQIHYSLMNDMALRKKFGTLGIPMHGPRSLLIRRHTEWMNLVNANCDSKYPKTKQDLLRDLQVWERTQAAQSSHNQLQDTSHVMHKAFDGDVWANDHQDDFKRLIEQARKKSKAVATQSDPQA